MVREEEIRKILDSREEIDINDVESTSIAAESLKPRFAADDNIHSHTVFIGAVCRDSLIAVDDKYSLHNAEALSLEATAQEIKDFCSNDAKVVDILGRISGAPDIEPETGLNMKDILIRAWAIAKNETLVYENRGLVIDALRHNLEAGGGCLAGISARLVAPYSVLLNQVMINSYNFKRFGVLPESLGYRDEREAGELELAKALSLTTFNDPELKDDDIRLAQAMSLSEQSGGESKGGESADYDFLLAQRLSVSQHQIDNLKAQGYSEEDAIAIAGLGAGEDELEDSGASLNRGFLKI